MISLAKKDLNGGLNYKPPFLLVVLFSTFLSLASVAHATSYVTMTDGRLLVFPDSCISSKVVNDTEVIFTALDGIRYAYPLVDIQSIDEQCVKELPSMTGFKFKDKDNYQLVDEATGAITDSEIDITVGGIGKWLTASFNLSDENARAYVDGKEQLSSVSRISYAHDRMYTVGYPGDVILAPAGDGKYALMPYGRQYTIRTDFLTDHSTSVPRIDINTVGGENISSKEYYLDAEIIIDGAGIFPSMTDSVQVKGRGNTSWSSNPDSKNPYRLKFNKKVKPLGLPKGKNWVLLANKMYASMLTNAYGMKAASLMGTVAANHIIPVDLYVNGTYKGSYNLTEKVGFASNSVDLDDEKPAALLELDNHYDEVDGQKFYSNPYLVPINIKEPEFADSGSTVLTFKDVKTRVNRMISEIYYERDILSEVDLESAARYTMFNEYICNYEILQPKSVFCYNKNILDDSSKFVFGPAWDFDWAFGYSTNHNYFKCNPAVDFYTALSSSHRKLFINMRYEPHIAARMLEIWEEFINNGLDELYDFCMEYYNYALPSFMNNKQAGLDNSNYEAIALRAGDWFKNRALAIYETLKSEVTPAGDANGDHVVSIEDVTVLIDYLLSGDAANVNIYGADTDRDGEITISDMAMLIDMLLSN